MDTILPPVEQIDKTKPYTDEQYAVIAKLPDEAKRAYMRGFTKTALWPQEDIERHYRQEHFPVIKYYSSGGGGTGTLTPPRPRI